MRAQQRDQMMRAWMMNQQFSQSQALQTQGDDARERLGMAEIADRGVGRQYEGGLRLNEADMRNAPLLAAQRFERDKWNTERDDGADARAMAKKLAAAKMGIFDEFFGGGAGAAPGQPMMPGQAPAPVNPQDARDRRAFKFGLMNMTAPVDPQEQAMERTRAMKENILTNRATNANPEDLPRIMSAMETGDLSNLPPAGGLNSQALGTYAQAQQAVAGDIQEVYAFLRKNNWNISDTDTATVAQKFQAISQKLDSFRVPQNIKNNILNDLKSKMQQALSENGVMFEAAGSDALRQQYGL